MNTFIMLTRLSPEMLHSPQELRKLEQDTMEQVSAACPDVKWISSFAVLGPYDYVDMFTAPDIETATKVSALVRTYGHAYSKIWPATEWGRFKEILAHLPAAGRA